MGLVKLVIVAVIFVMDLDYKIVLKFLMENISKPLIGITKSTLVGQLKTALQTADFVV